MTDAHVWMMISLFAMGFIAGSLVDLVVTILAIRDARRSGRKDGGEA